MREMLVFSDLHANREALKDISSMLDKVDLTIFCGDLLGYGKDIDYCIDFILEKIDYAVLGDHERFAITNENLDGQLPVVRESVLYTRSRLSKKQIEQLSSLPREIWIEDIYITHSIDDHYLRTEADFRMLLAKMPEKTKYAFFGHTHEQVLFKFGDKTLVNPGSITKGRRGFHRSYALINDETVRFVNLEDIL